MLQNTYRLGGHQCCHLLASYEVVAISFHSTLAFFHTKLKMHANRQTDRQTHTHTHTNKLHNAHTWGSVGIRKLQIRYEFKRYRYDRGISMYHLISTELTTKLQYRSTETQYPRRCIGLTTCGLRQTVARYVIVPTVRLRLTETCTTALS